MKERVEIAIVFFEPRESVRPLWSEHHPFVYFNSASGNPGTLDRDFFLALAQDDNGAGALVDRFYAALQ